MKARMRAGSKQDCKVRASAWQVLARFLTEFLGDDEDDDAVKELSSESAQDPTPLLETAGGAAVDDDDDDVVSIEGEVRCFYSPLFNVT